MRLQICALGLLVGCTGTANDDYPIRTGNGGNVGGGTGTGSGSAVDAGVDGGNLAVGRVCLTTDLRAVETCASTGAAGITVRRGTATATTRADGKFDLPPATAVGDWVASRADLMTSVLPYAAGAQVLVPAITTVNWNALANASGINLGDGQGVLHVTSHRPSGLPKPGVVVSTDPAGPSSTYYAGTTAVSWVTTQPSALGAAIVPGLLQGTINAVAGVAADGSRTLSLVPIVANAITFVRLDFLK